MNEKKARNHLPRKKKHSRFTRLKEIEERKIKLSHRWKVQLFTQQFWKGRKDLLILAKLNVISYTTCTWNNSLSNYLGPDTKVNHWGRKSVLQELQNANIQRKRKGLVTTWSKIKHGNHHNNFVLSYFHIRQILPFIYLLSELKTLPPSFKNSCAVKLSCSWQDPAKGCMTTCNSEHIQCLNSSSPSFSV